MRGLCFTFQLAYKVFHPPLSQILTCYAPVRYRVPLFLLKEHKDSICSFHLFLLKEHQEQRKCDGNPIQLACVMPSTSVPSEPESNSTKKSPPLETPYASCIPRPPLLPIYTQFCLFKGIVPTKDPGTFHASERT